MNFEGKLTILKPLKISPAMATALDTLVGPSRKHAEFIRECVALRLVGMSAKREIPVTLEEMDAIAEARRLGVDPIAAIRDRVQEVERDQVLAGKTINVIAA